MNDPRDTLKRAADAIDALALAADRDYATWAKDANGDALRADAAALRRMAEQEPVATLHDDGHWTWKPGHIETIEQRQAGWRMEVYAAPVAPIAPADDARDAEIKALRAVLRRDRGCASGNYMITCRGCGKPQVGYDKRAARCAACADALIDKEIAFMKEPK